MIIIFKYSILILILFQLTSIFGQRLIPYRVKDKWGYVDTSMNIFIKPKYEAVGERYSYGGKSWVKRKGKYFIIDSTGKYSANKVAYDFIRYKQNRLVVLLNKKEYCIDQYGDTTSKCGFYYTCGTTSDYLMNYFTTFQQGDKKGFTTGIDGNLCCYRLGTLQGKFDSIPAQWDYIRENHLGTAIVGLNSKYGIISPKAEYIQPMIYDTVIFQNNYMGNYYFVRNPPTNYYMVKKGDYMTYFDKDGQPVWDFKYSRIHPFIRKIAKVEFEDGFWGYIDENGKEYFVH